jgi:hypothetical protein
MTVMWRGMTAAVLAVWFLGGCGESAVRTAPPASADYVAAAGSDATGRATRTQTLSATRPVSHASTLSSEFQWTARVSAGRARRSFVRHGPAGTIQLLQITAPRGTDVTFTGEIPDLAGVRITTGQPATCRIDHGRETCTQPEEGCPMPVADWHFQMFKRSGPPGLIVLRFAIMARSMIL